MPRASTRSIRARAWCLGTRLDLRQRSRPDTSLPILEAHGVGRLALFRFGVVVAFDLDDRAEADAIESLRPSIDGPYDPPESEQYTIRIDPLEPEQIDARGDITLRELSNDRILVVAHALAKSVVLARFESQISPTLARAEQVALELQAGLSSARRGQLLSEIGNVLLIESRTVGRIQITEKPDLTWDNVELDRLYERLESDLELRERDLALSRKLALISRISELYLNLLHSRQGLRVEWYIVILILVEIVLSLYALLAGAGA